MAIVIGGITITAYQAAVFAIGAATILFLANPETQRQQREAARQIERALRRSRRPRRAPEPETTGPTPVPLPRICEDCNEDEARRFAVAVMAQGTDCGGKSSSTISSGAINKPVPITTAQGIAKSNATWALLDRSQKGIRERAKMKLEKFIRSGPPGGHPPQQKTFPASDRRGGKRYDLDIFGSGPSFLA